MQLNLIDHHRALADADATADALRRMLSEVDPARSQSIDGFLDYMRRMKKGGTERLSIRSRLCDAAQHNGTIEIAYTDVQGPGALITRRRITVDRVRAHNVEAWCHLRSERRVFRLERIQGVGA
jgi:predicted DNA-binding transcriptional regulator YafY